MFSFHNSIGSDLHSKKYGHLEVDEMAAATQSSTFKRPFYNMDNPGVSLYRDLKLKRRRILDLVGCDTDSCVSNESRRSMGSESSGYVSDCDQFSDASIESANSPHNLMPAVDDSTKIKSVDAQSSSVLGDKASNFAEKQRFEEFTMKVKVEANSDSSNSNNNNDNNNNNNDCSKNSNNNQYNHDNNVAMKNSTSMNCNTPSDIDNTNCDIGSNNSSSPVNMPFGVAYVGFPPGFVWHQRIINDQSVGENMTTVNMIPVMTTVATPTVHTMPTMLNTNSNANSNVTEISHVNFVLDQPPQITSECIQPPNAQPQPQTQQITIPNASPNQASIQRPGAYQICQYPYINPSHKEFEQRGVPEAKKPWVVPPSDNHPSYMCMTPTTATCSTPVANSNDNGTGSPNNPGGVNGNNGNNNHHHHHHHHYHSNNSSNIASNHLHHNSNNNTNTAITHNSNNNSSSNTSPSSMYYHNSVQLNKESEVCRIDEQPCNTLLDSDMKVMDVDSDNEEPMICAICNDRATGLHYGIITCEGCKGFFKRTVQNKRVYTCVASGNCEINKMQRNRCQYCRFKKCLQMGMVLAAVREDRMPGGRNSGAVYNLYKVKYKKHKRKKQVAKLYKQKVAQISVDQDMNIKTEPVDIRSQLKIPLESSSSVMNPRRTTIVAQYNPVAAFTQQQQQQQHQQQQQQQQQHQQQQQQQHQQQQQQQQPHQQRVQLPGIHQQQQIQQQNCQADIKGGQFQYQNEHSKHIGSRPQPVKPPPSQPQPTQLMSLMPVAAMPQFERLINELIQCDCLLDIADACKLDELVNDDIVSNTLYKIGDNIVNNLVKWTRQLPFYSEIPLQIHQQILTEKWHELLLLITTSHRALVNSGRMSMTFGELYRWNMSKLAKYLNKNFEKYFTLEELTNEIGEIVEKITHVMAAFMNINLSKQEYVCLQVVLLLNQNQTMPVKEVEKVQDRYTNALQQYIAVHHPDEPNRFGELLLRLPEIQSASALLLKSKMIYVPFLLTS